MMWEDRKADREDLIVQVQHIKIYKILDVYFGCTKLLLFSLIQTTLLNIIQRFLPSVLSLLHTIYVCTYFNFFFKILKVFICSLLYTSIV